MDIPSLLSTKERARLLSYILAHPGAEIAPDRVAKEVRVSRSQAHKYAGILRHEGLLKGKRLQETLQVRALRALLNADALERAGVAGILRRRFPKASGIWIFGSWAFGTNAEGSDLDIWIKMETAPSDLEMARAKKEISEKMSAPVDIVAATPKRMAAFREKSDAFYFSLYNGQVLWGDGL